MEANNQLKIKAKIITDGIKINLLDKDYLIKFPRQIWQDTPEDLKNALLENLTLACTNFLPLILNKKNIEYNFPQPALENFLFKNHLYDLLDCEEADGVQNLSYLRDFYNLNYKYQEGETTLPAFPENKEEISKPTAIVPFTFGKESLLVVALCKDLGIEPILLYCEEPAHPYEKKYKLESLKKFSKEFNLKYYFIENETGLFRYGQAFNLKKHTELGWGLQTTALALMSLPFAYKHHAKYILFGSESLNNQYSIIENWKHYISYDQTPENSKNLDTAIRILSNNNCRVKTILSPIEEINNFYILHHSYPAYSKYQFSCGGTRSLYQNTQWCHNCYKCARMYLFAKCLNIDPEKIGFKKDLLSKLGMFDSYLDNKKSGGSTWDLDYAFHILARKKILTPDVQKFISTKKPLIKSWGFYYKFFTEIKQSDTMPEEYKNKLLKFFEEEMAYFKKVIKMEK